MKRFIMAAIAALSFSASAAQAQLFPSVVDDLEVGEFTGKWYEVASTKPAFQANCVCVTAEYEIKEDGNLSVINTCRKFTPDGEIDQVIGEAKTTRNPGKLNVSFGGFSLPFSNYWVVDIAEDYSWAAISSPFRNPIWILSRTPDLDQSIIDEVLAGLNERGFNVSGVTPTLQEGCNN